jgi:hypothetical protein
MQPRRIDGRAYARRLSLVLSLGTLAFLASPARASAADLTGTVVDQNGPPLPRAHDQEPLGHQALQRAVRAAVRIGL